ncbi:Dolichyl-phosphate-mannose-glycolipid alpha-mannosyltransferase [Scheffersomyces amazonensis]|uniref:Dolichyl-phosphate-mannose-glycolipid alpha-mannosyltransferase n=1 Tax=Scheffersomyces amazonensis TaxID=1078765 RepID=UPI00315CB34B
MTEAVDQEKVQAQSIGQKPKAELPEFTFRNVLGDIRDGIYALLYNPETNKIVIPILVSLTSIIAKFIIRFVPYTEIDFITYMQQIHLINDGELDYNKIFGDTGPIVYPAGYVQIYQWINYLTNNGTDIKTGQSIFGYLLTLTNLLVLVAFSFTNIPPWPLYFLLLSRRLISIYVLRLFNDCFTTICMVGVTIFLQQASYWHKSSKLISFLLVALGSDLLSIAISIKMNALLYVPGFLIVSYFLVEENIFKFLIILVIIPLIQLITGWNFLLPLYNDEEAKIIRWNYINQAFDFKRKFLYKWTVNWKFISEETFLSDSFATTLLIGHLTILVAFTLTRYINIKVTGKSISQLIIDAFKPNSTIINKTNLFIDANIGPRLILLTLSTSNVIGVLFSRSLHYQFLSWYCWQLPFLLYATGWNFIISFIIWSAHEWCWNVYPAHALSSGLLVTILSLILIAVWRNEKFWYSIKIDT